MTGDQLSSLPDVSTLMHLWNPPPVELPITRRICRLMAVTNEVESFSPIEQYIPRKRAVDPRSMERDARRLTLLLRLQAERPLSFSVDQLLQAPNSKKSTLAKDLSYLHIQGLVDHIEDRGQFGCVFKWFATENK
jgi:hypothetical protein